MEDMDTMLGNVAGHLASFEDSNQEFTVWVNALKEASNCEEESDFSAEKFKKPTKEVLSKCLYTAYQLIDSYMGSFPKVRNDVEELKSCLIRSQNSVIKLQGELLEVKSEQLESVQTVMKTAVQDTVQTEMKSYSQAVLKSPPSAAPTFTTENLKKVVQNVVAEEDRGKNVVVFGLLFSFCINLNTNLG